MTPPGSEESTFWMWLTGLIASAVAGVLSLAFGYTHNRISQMRDDARISLKEAVESVNARLDEGRRDRDDIRTMVSESQVQHQAMLVQITNLPTRTEIKGDLDALEKRITTQVDRVLFNHPQSH